MPFLPFVYRYLSSSPCAHCIPNKSVPTLHYTHRHDLYRQVHAEGSYWVQSPGLLKTVYCTASAAHFFSTDNSRGTTETTKCCEKEDA